MLLTHKQRTIILDSRVERDLNRLLEGMLYLDSLQVTTKGKATESCKVYTMNAIENSLINSLNMARGKKGNWKVFSSMVIKSNLKLNDKEEKLYQVVKSYLEKEENKTFTTLPTDKFKSILIQWDNGKVFESVNTLITEKELDRVLKFYFKETFLNAGNRCYCLAMNEKDTKHVYIVNVSKSCGVYKFEEKKEDTTENETTEETTETTENDTLLKIATLLNSVYALSKDLDNDTKKSIIEEFVKSMGIKENAIVTSKNKKSA